MRSLEAGAGELVDLAAIERIAELSALLFLAARLLEAGQAIGDDRPASAMEIRGVPRPARWDDGASHRPTGRRADGRREPGEPRGSEQRVGGSGQLRTAF